MSRLIDSFAVWLICVAFAVAGGAVDERSVAGALIALIVLCACQLVRPFQGRAIVLTAFLVACAAWAPASAFLPLGACLCMFEQPRLLRALWVLAWVALALQQGFMQEALLLVLCVAAALLAWSASLDRASRRRMRLSRDGVREQMIGLAERTRAIQQQLEDRAEPEPEPACAPDPFEGLTDRERQIALLVAEGMDNRAIAADLFLSEGTVRNNISTILQKKQLKNRTQLAVLYLSR